jgi:hypothetical protein
MWVAMTITGPVIGAVRFAQEQKLIPGLTLIALASPLHGLTPAITPPTFVYL